MSEIKNVLASRYASKDIKEIYSEEGKILLEREFWIAVLKGQRKLGVDIPKKAISAYEKVKNQIDLPRILKKERLLRHDVKARIETFCELAGYEHIHKGLTSRDLTDNVEQYQVYKALKVTRKKVVKSLQIMAQRALEYRDLVITGRTHNVAAQPTTFGKRIAMTGQELLLALDNLTQVINHYSLRGLKGAVGTLLDQETLFNGDTKKLKELEESISLHLGFHNVLNAVGQVYPRSMDFQVITALFQLAAGPSSFCKSLRLMAGAGLITEGFKKGQVGSSSMPHKMNTRSCERVNGFKNILQGYVSMTMGISGDQWNEGDVSCSVVRRVALPDSFFAIDGLLETFITILAEMGTFDAVIETELYQYLPFLATTTLLMEAVKMSIGREKAHNIIKKHATATVINLRTGKIKTNDLLNRLDKDKEFPLDLKDLKRLLDDPKDFIGLAQNQVTTFVKQVDKWVKKFPEATKINPGEIL